MTLPELIAHLRSLGIELSADGENLRFKAPKGALTAELKMALVAAKPEVLTALTAEEALVTEPSSRHEPFPLTDVQASYLVGRTNAFQWGGVGCHAYAEFDVDYAAVPGHSWGAEFRAAWWKVLRRHEMLRCVVYPEGYQRVDPDFGTVDDPVGLTVHTLIAEEVSPTRTRIARELARRAYAPGVGPMFDAVLTIGPDDTILHFSLDLLIADFASVALIMRDYHLFLAYPELELPKPSLSFRDYVLNLTRADRSPRENRKRSQDLAYWQDRLDTLPPPATLPLLPDPGTLTQPTFTRRALRLTGQQWSVFTQCAAARGITANAALLAAFGRVLGRYGERDHFFLTLTTMNRRQIAADIHETVGDFTGTSVLEVDVRGAGSFAAMAKHLGQRLFEDMDHDHVTGVEIVRELARRDDSRGQLSPIVFTSTLGAGRALFAAAPQQSAILIPRPGSGISQTPQVLLDCQVSEVIATAETTAVKVNSLGVDINWDTRDGAIPAAILDRAFADFTTIATELSTDPAAWDRTPLPSAAPPLTVIDPLPPFGVGHSVDARRGAATAIDQRGVGEERARFLQGGFVRQALINPEAVAIIHGPQVISYSELLTAALAVASELRRAGVRARDLVTVRLEADPKQIAALLGVLVAGAAYVPLDARWPDARVAQIVEQCRPAAQIEAAGDIADLLAAPETWIPNTVRDFESFSAAGELVSDNGLAAAKGLVVAGELVAAAEFRGEITPEDLAYIIFTSGTTGTPKGVAISHAAAVNTLTDLNARFGITAEDAVLAVSQHTFDLSIYNIFGLLGAGGRLVIPEGTERANPQSWLRAIDDHNVTVWNSVPAQMQLLLDYLPATPPGGLPSLRRIMLSGDWIPVSQPVDIARVAPKAHAYSLGGATEAAIWSIHHRLEATAYQRSVPYGTALANQSVRVLTHRGELAAPGQIGEIHIGGIGLATGYFRDPDRTAAAFVTHPLTGERLYRTGDYGRPDGNGVIELLGRRDNQVKIRGHRIELADVESALDSLPGVAAAVAYVFGDRHRPALAATITPALAPASEITQRAARAAALAAAAREAHAQLTVSLDESALTDFAMSAKTVALQGMTAVLTAALPAGKCLPLPELADRLHATDGRAHLLNRWLAALAEEGLVRHHPDNTIELVTPTDPDTLAECVVAWANVRELAKPLNYGDDLLAYVGECLAVLPDLLAGRLDPRTLLFPEGRTDIALAAYRDNLQSRYLNSVLTAQITEFAQHHPTSLRVLEVGAGVGGTTAGILKVLRGHVHYTFTDISSFFLAEARKTLVENGIDFRRFDLNADPAGQGFADASFDLIVCANVLHDATHIPTALTRLHRLLVPGGALAVIEPTAFNHAVAISQEFLVWTAFDTSAITDSRAGADSPFLDHPQWRRALDDAGFTGTQSFPPSGHFLENLGQHVFWCTQSSPASVLRPSALLERVREILPSYMVPQHLTPRVDLPLTANGKVDRQKIRLEAEKFLEAARADIASTGAALTPWQSRIAEIWAEALDVDVATLAPDSDFFHLGGDSLVLAQMIGQVRAEIPTNHGWDDLLRILVADPTLAGAARILESSTAKNSAGQDVSPLIRLNAPETEVIPDRPLVVLVHDGSGGLGPYHDLIAAFGASDQPFDLYGLRRVPGDGYLGIEPEHLFTTLAARYGQAIAALRPTEVRLVGYCMGGLLSLDIAKYLEEEGISVSEVAAVSSYRVPVEVDDEDMFDYWLARLMGLGSADLGLGDLDAEFAAAFAAVRANITAGEEVSPGTLRRLNPVLARALTSTPAPGEQRMRALAESGALGFHWDAKELTELREVFIHSLRAVIRCSNEPYPGDVRFLRQRGDIHFLPEITEVMTEFWENHCAGTFTRTDIDGHHFDCLKGENARAVADLLTKEWSKPLVVQ